MKVTVVRAFCLQGARQEPGTTIELADHLVRELVALGKVAPAGEALPAVAGPMTTESVSELVQGKTRRGAKDVG